MMDSPSRSMLELATHPFDAVTFFGMIVLTVTVVWRAVLVFSGGDTIVRNWSALIAGLVMMISAVAASLGLFSPSTVALPAFQAFMGALLLAACALGFSSLGRRLAAKTSLTQLVLLQAFRLPLEVLMYRAALHGIMPLTFSFSGYNFDIVTGVLALGLGLALVLNRQVPRWALQVWNFWGMACLIVIGALAFALSPNFSATSQDPARVITWVLYFPYSWLPHVLVMVAVLGHIMITIKLKDMPSSDAA